MKNKFRYTKHDMASIFFVEDDETLRPTIVQWLESDHHRVEFSGNGTEAWEFICMRSYDLIILDWDLPGITGLEICKQYRAKGGKTPIVMLTGKSAVKDRVDALDIGADDYVVKPFAVQELLSRVRAILRRPSAYVSEVLEAGDVSLDTVKRRVKVAGSEIHLKPIEYAVLEFFLRNPNKVISPDLLLQHVWSSDSEGSVEAVYVCINRLRKKIKSDRELIHTVHGSGYQLVLPD